MRTFGVIAAVCAALVVGVSNAAAQNGPNTGLVMASGTTVGLQIAAGENIAIRPNASFQRTSHEFDGDSSGTSQTGTAWSAGADLLFYVTRWDKTRLYVSPQYSYLRATSNSEAKATEHTAAVMVGAEHRLGTRFAVFGETGINWSRTRNTNSVGINTTVSKSLNATSVVGGILFF